MRELANLTHEELVDIILSYENGITWMTACVNCAKLMDDNYRQYCVIAELQKHVCK